MKRILNLLFVLFLPVLVVMSAVPAGAASSHQVSAQDSSATAAAEAAVAALPDRIVRPMRAMDPITLRAEGILIRLWGIKPAQTSETPLDLKALDLMDGLIQEQEVNCKIVGGAMPEYYGRCATAGNHDLALDLLGAGLAVVDRRQTYDSVFATAYEKAQESARISGRGVWAFVNKEQRDRATPKWLEDNLGVIMPVGLIFGPFGGLLIIAFVMRHWLKTMSETQRRDIERVQQKEETLQLRERQVLVTTLEGELTENKNKVEAFMVIYGDMLRSLKEPNGVPPYQQAGDIVQKHPNFSKAVFETNVSKLSLLDIKLAGQLSKLYTALPSSTAYINLDQSVPLETAVALVEKVLKDTEGFLPPIELAITALQASAAAARRS